MKDTMSGSQKGKAMGMKITGPTGPIKRTLPNGDILSAWSEPAKQSDDPLLVLDELAKNWRRG